MEKQNFLNIEGKLLQTYGPNCFLWPMDDKIVRLWAENQKSSLGYLSDAAKEILNNDRSSAKCFGSYENC